MPAFLVAATLLAGLAVRVNAQTAEDPEPEPPDETAAPETLGRLTLTLDPGGHTAPIAKVFFTPEGHLITSAYDGSIRVWDAETGRTRQVLRLPGRLSPNALTLSLDRKLLGVACHYDAAKEGGRILYLVGVADGRIQRVLRTGHVGNVRALAFSPDGTRLASSSMDGRIEIASLDKDAPAQVLKPKGPVVALAFSSDGKRLVEAHPDGFDIRHLAGGKITPLPGGYVPSAIHASSDSVAWSRDGKTVATAARDGVRLWEPDGKLRFHLGTTDSKVKLKDKLWAFAVSFSPASSQVVVTWHYDKSATVFDVKTGKEKAHLSPRVAADTLTAPRNSAFAPDGKHIATVGSHEGTHATVLWKTADGSETRRLGAPSWLTGTELQAGWSTDGNAVSWRSATRSATAKGKPGSFDWAALELRPPLSGKVAGALHEQGPFTLKVQDKQTVQLLKNKKPVGELKFTGERRLGSYMTFLGKNRAIVSENGHIAVVFDTDKAKQLRLLVHDGVIRGLAPSPKGDYLLSFSTGQRLHIWNLERQTKPLLTLYVAGQDWVAWTDKGYYAATPGGERLMGWTVDNGIDKETTYYPVEQFRRQMYRPDIIQLVLEKGSVAEAVLAADAIRKTHNVEVPRGEANPEKLLPPGVTLTLVDQSKLPKVTLKVAARQTCAEQPIKSLRLLVDGRTLPNRQALVEFEEGKEKTEHELTWKDLVLPPGKHKLSVLARSKDDTPGISNLIEVACPLPEDERPVVHHIAVGISKYANAKLNLQFADTDARQLAEAFQTVAKAGKLYRHAEVQKLLNAEATCAAVLQAIDAVKKSPPKPSDLFVLSFAGHGVREEGEFYLLTHEADPSSAATLKKTALSGSMLREKLTDFPCQVLLLLDACHSGSFGGYRPGADEAARTLSDVDVRVTVMCAALGHEEALEKDGNGLFTKAVVRALKHDANAFYDKETGELNVYHLQAFVYQEVAKASEAKQTPYLKMPLAQPAFVVTQFAQ